MSTRPTTCPCGKPSRPGREIMFSRTHATKSRSPFVRGWTSEAATIEHCSLTCRDRTWNKLALTKLEKPKLPKLPDHGKKIETIAKKSAARRRRKR